MEPGEVSWRQARRAAEHELPAVPGPWNLTLHQRVDGYRFSLDAFLLADFVPPHAGAPIIDLGTGCGVIALFLARRFPHRQLVGLEFQASLASLAHRNAMTNQLQHQVSVVRGDICEVTAAFTSGSFGTVVCNPPYRAVGHGRLNPHTEKAIARHEIAVTLAQVIKAARHLLWRRGIFVMVYHPERLAELCAHLDAAHLRPRRLRLVHATPQAPASIVLLEAIHSGRDALLVLPPLFVNDATGDYSEEMQAIFQGRALRAGSQM